MGRLENIMKNSHAQTLGACFWMLLGSFLPIFVEAIIKCWLFSKGFWVSFFSGLNGGEVFILTTAMIAPFFWLIIKIIGSKSAGNYPWFGFFFVSAIFSFCGGLLSFSYFRIGQYVKGSEFDGNKEVLFYFESLFSHDFTFFAVVIYLFSLIVWYYSSYQESNNSPSYDGRVAKIQEALKEKVFND